jgi:hypothetical protein
MNKFIKEYGYDKDTILAATKAYLKENEDSAEGHLYTSNSTYFIMKERTGDVKNSNLAIACKRYLDGNYINQEYIERDAM